MLTAGTYNRERLLNTDAKKNNVFRFLKETTDLYDWKVIAWVVLDNHYHTFLKSPDSDSSNTIDKLISVLSVVKWHPADDIYYVSAQHPLAAFRRSHQRSPCGACFDALHIIIPKLL